MQTWYSANTSGGQGLVCENETGRSVAATYDEADAPLVAAAPALLATLQGLIDAVSADIFTDAQEYAASVAAVAALASEGRSIIAEATEGRN